MWNKTAPEPPKSNYTSPEQVVRKIKERAVIGSSIIIRGDLNGEEDVLIQGKIEGKVSLKNHNVTIGEKGRVEADIYAKLITVEGEFRGNLYGSEKIIIRRSGRLRGNLVAPLISLEDGASFKGKIDMEVATGKSADKAVRPTIRKRPENKQSTATQKKVLLKASADLGSNR